MNSRLKGRKELENDFEFTPPKITFKDRMKLYMGDVTVEMVYLGMAHSGADILIHIPEEKILLVGDTFSYRYLPYISADDNHDIPEWINVLDYFLNQDRIRNEPFSRLEADVMPSLTYNYLLIVSFVK